MGLARGARWWRGSLGVTEAHPRHPSGATEARNTERAHGAVRSGPEKLIETVSRRVDHIGAGHNAVSTNIDLDINDEVLDVLGASRNVPACFDLMDRSG